MLRHIVAVKHMWFIFYHSAIAESTLQILYLCCFSGFFITALLPLRSAVFIYFGNIAPTKILIHLDLCTSDSDLPAKPESCKLDIQVILLEKGTWKEEKTIKR